MHIPVHVPFIKNGYTKSYLHTAPKLFERYIMVWGNGPLSHAAPPGFTDGGCCCVTRYEPLKWNDGDKTLPFIRDRSFLN